FNVCREGAARAFHGHLFVDAVACAGNVETLLVPGCGRSNGKTHHPQQDRKRYLASHDDPLLPSPTQNAPARRSRKGVSLPLRELMNVVLTCPLACLVSPISLPVEGQLGFCVIWARFTLALGKPGERK